MGSFYYLYYNFATTERLNPYEDVAVSSRSSVCVKEREIAPVMIARRPPSGAISDSKKNLPPRGNGSSPSTAAERSKAEPSRNSFKGRKRTRILWSILVVTVAANLLLIGRTIQVLKGSENIRRRPLLRPVEIGDLSEWTYGGKEGGWTANKYRPLASWKKYESYKFKPIKPLPPLLENNNNPRPGRPSNPLANAKTTQTNISFCLLIKDDNDILNEWIAYHYHLWNLRRLVVAVDPSSQTSPKEVLQVWSDEFGLEFEIWEDRRYLPDYFLQGRYDMVPRMIKMDDKNATKWQDSHDQSSEMLQQKYVEINNHRYRQARFLQHCSKAIQGNSHSSAASSYSPTSSLWVTHIDTDEYIFLNPTLLEQEQTEQQERHQPSLPTELSSGSLLNFLEQAIRVDADNRVNWPCISMPRILYGSVEDPPTTDASVWNRGRFETLRWKYHADFNNRDLNKQPKVIMDVTGFPPFNVTRKAFSIHRPNIHLCRMQAQMNVQDTARYPIVVHHYLGSLERYQARHDPRRTLALYQQKASFRDGKDATGWIDGWLSEFVKENGNDKVSKVLWQYQQQGAFEEEEEEEDIEEKPKPKQLFGGVVGSALKNKLPEQVLQDMEKEDKEYQDKDKPPRLGLRLPKEEVSFSACLIVKDDNDILNEWIAYHHHVLKLRTMIVAVDPSSKTSPAALLARWGDLMDEIQIWDDTNYMPDFFLKGRFDMVPDLWTNSTTSLLLAQGNANETQVQQSMTHINNHRFRQLTFLSKCVKTLKAQNKTFTFHIDTDEYITLHPKIRNQSNWRHLPLDPKIRPNSIFDFFLRASGEYTKGLSYPCTSMPRLLYGAKEDSADPSRFAKIPQIFDGNKFETISWKYHSNYNAGVDINGKPKVILDVSGLPPEANVLKGGIYSIHRPALFLCRGASDVTLDKPSRFPLMVNHYIGSWERFNARSDARRNRAIYDKRAHVDAGKDDDWIDGWVASFVQKHGLANATRLLSSYTKGEVTTDWEAAKDSEEDLSVEADRALIANNGVARTLNMTDFLTSLEASTSRTEFSACLLVKDDNDILNEWIAYHYHVLGLRYIIVAIDAKSHTSPSALLDQWRQFGMEIEEWNDEMFMPDIYFQKAYHLQPRLVKIKKNKHKWLEGIDDPEVKMQYFNAIQDHRFRQITFVASCAKKLRDLGRTWMIHIDTDEYLVINPKLRERGKFAGTIPIPTTAEASIVPRLLNQMVSKSWETVNYPCISLPRLFYGSIEDPGNVNVPSGFNHSRFESLRWKYHADLEDSSLNKQPKVLMDVSAIPADDKMFVENRVFSIHRPSQSLCRTQGQMLFDDTDLFPFSVNHYLGTFERFSSRDDPRRNRKLYEQKSHVRAGKDDDHWIDSWLPKFIEAHSEERVGQLLNEYRNH